ncbi:PadR family transcriptional regulator [Kitasatospora aureofaciens]|uniref:PadR family transcriptional regulator n=1 Tax=Kitasatospora aureofaciens TaxID=1894 RepID=UPI003F4D5C41
MSSILDPAILGFLYEEPLHGYELRVRIAWLSGHVRAVSHGTLHPAIKRLEAAGVLRNLGEPAEPFTTDENRWFVLLAFLRHLPGEAYQVLKEEIEKLDTSRGPRS